MSTNDPANPLATMEVNASPTGAPAAAAPVAPHPQAAPSGYPPAAHNAPATGATVDSGDPDIPGETQEQATGVGTDGETTVWEARYSMKNFIGRLILWSAATIAWVALAVWVWEYEHTNWSPAAILSGIVVGFMWLALLRRIVMARYGHYYRLTNRRIFVSTGLFNRRRDQMELLRVQDVYTRQSLMQRWMSVGTVTIVSSEPHFPVIYLTGVDDPKAVMDVVWHHARAERDRRSVKVDQI